MKHSIIRNALIGILGCALFAMADNPIVNYHYLADPTAFTIGDEFWIIADLDDESVSGYVIKAYYAISSKDMVNWTDHGEVFRVPRDMFPGQEPRGHLQPCSATIRCISITPTRLAASALPRQALPSVPTLTQ